MNKCEESKWPTRLVWFGLVWNPTYGHYAAVKIKVVIHTEADISVLRVVFTLQQEGGSATTPICNPSPPTQVEKKTNKICRTMNERNDVCVFYTNCFCS